MGKLERRILTKHWGFNTLTLIAIFVSYMDSIRIDFII